MLRGERTLKVKVMACAGESVEMADVPEEIRLLPIGHVTSTKGDFDVDDDSALDIMRISRTGSWIW